MLVSATAKPEAGTVIGSYYEYEKNFIVPIAYLCRYSIVNIHTRRIVIATLLSLALVLLTFASVLSPRLHPMLDLILLPGFTPLQCLTGQGSIQDVLPILTGFLLNVGFYAVVFWLLLKAFASGRKPAISAAARVQKSTQAQ
ncbi:MAG: hypothetical protein ABI824_02115 [Acidobacteriota bacterium]